MMDVKKIIRLLLLPVLILTGLSVFAQTEIRVPLGGNTYFEGNYRNKIRLGKEGITQWSDPSVSPQVYVRVTKTGDMSLSLNAKSPGKENRLKVSIDKKSYAISINSEDWKDYKVGTFKIKDTGYICVKIEATGTAGKNYPDISDLVLTGDITKSTVYYAKDDFYWGRRGPSVHLSYQMPRDKNIEWFYNELTIPKGLDPLGSYFMSNGFGEGYFGIQVNSPTERRILFSVWSPFSTDDPKAIPDSLKIKLLKKGEITHVGEFGNEGSGGQSYVKYNWEAGTTYKFLTRIKPDDKGNTTYTAFFFDPKANNWMLIASFLRPKTNTWYKGAHSFLENFSPDMGAINRKVYCSNQWVCDKDGNWIELTKATFTADATARKQSRMDYAGGEESGKFYMTNCGFFSKYTPIGSSFERRAANQKPEINLEDLKTLANI